MWLIEGRKVYSVVEDLQNNTQNKVEFADNLGSLRSKRVFRKITVFVSNGKRQGQCLCILDEMYVVLSLFESVCKRLVNFRQFNVVAIESLLNVNKNISLVKFLLAVSYVGGCFLKTVKLAESSITK